MSVFCVAILWTPIAFSLCDAGEVPECKTISAVADLESLLSGVSCIRSKYQEKRLIANMSKPFQSSGELLVVRGLGVILSQQNPVVKTTVLGSSGTFENMIRTASVPDFVQKSLLALFSLQFNRIRGDFVDAVVSTYPYYQISFKPRSEVYSKNLSEIVLEGSCYPSKLEIKQANGESRQYNLQDQTFAPFEVTSAEKELLQLVSR